MFASRGNLSTSNAEALKIFCSLINEAGQTFHPTFLLELIKKREKEKGSFHPSVIDGIVKASYEMALIKHSFSKKKKAPPRRITFKDRLERGACTLQYKTGTGNGVRLELSYPNPTNVVLPQLIVFGQSEHCVCRQAAIANLPEPVCVFGPLRNIPIPEFDPGLMELQNLASRLTQVNVPAGELLDFLEKYRS